MPIFKTSTTIILFIGLITNFLIFPSSICSAGISPTGQNMLDFLDATAGNAGLNKIDSGETAAMNIVGGIINVALSLIGIIFFILMLWAGIRWMTSQGNEEMIKEAKNTIRTAIIGIVVVFSSFLITNFILNQVKKINSSTVPLEQPLGTCSYKFARGELGEICSTIPSGYEYNATESRCREDYDYFISHPNNIGCGMRWTPN